jgi:hypothetical protein
MNKITKGFAAAGLAVGLSLGAGLAFATFTTNSEPQFQAQAATIVHPNAVVNVVGDLWPGYMNDVTVTITNPNPVAVKIRSFDTRAPFFPQDLTATDDLARFITQVTPTSENGKVIGAHDTRTFTLHNVVGLKSEAADAQQGDKVNLSYSIAYDQIAGNETP